MKNEYHVENGVAIIQLTHGQVCRIDEVDLALVDDFRWRAVKQSNGYYAIARQKRSRGTVTMHTLICPPPPGFWTDHIDGDTLNNLRSNLRSLTPQENAWNRAMSCRNTSGYKGVTWSARSGKWRARIRIHDRNVHLGLFATREEAAAAYNVAAQAHRGGIVTERVLNCYSGSVL